MEPSTLELSYSQISIMEFEDKPVEKIIIPYDSLSNFHREKYGDKYLTYIKQG